MRKLLSAQCVLVLPVLAIIALLITGAEGLAATSVVPAPSPSTQPPFTQPPAATAVAQPVPALSPTASKPTAKPKAKTHSKAVHTAAPNDAADLRRIEEYLNNLRTISADFLQVDDMGGMMTGTIALSRRTGQAGRMRVTYAPPSRDFIVADGTIVSIWNDELQSQTNVLQGESLAEFILRSPLKLSGDVKVMSLKHFPAKIELALAQKDDEASGQLVLVFEDRPLRLRQWKVISPDGRMTGVTLQNVREDVDFSDNMFHFVPPNFGKSRR